MATINMEGLTEPHSYTQTRNKVKYTSVEWYLTPQGLRIDKQYEVTDLKYKLMARIWKDYHQHIIASAEKHSVPVELIAATIATESAGKPRALRKEPGYKSDNGTPHRVSPGLMQTLISTARMATGIKNIGRTWLYVPENSIEAGTAYIAMQRKHTVYDPPIVAAAYNAGGVYLQTGKNNRWKMRNFPIGGSTHINKFCKYFNDCWRMFSEMDIDDVPTMSFYRTLNQGGTVTPPATGGNALFELLKKAFLPTLLTGIGGMNGCASLGKEAGTVTESTMSTSPTVAIAMIAGLLFMAMMNNGGKTDLPGILKGLFGLGGGTAPDVDKN